MIKKLLKFAISLAAIKWLAKKMSHHHSNNGKQVEPLRRNWDAKWKRRKWVSRYFFC